MQKASNIEFMLKVLNSQYQEYNFTILNMTCPARENESNSNNNCSESFNAKEPSECFDKTLTDKENNYCCFAKLSVDDAAQTGCKEIPKNESLSDIKQRIIEAGKEFNVKVDNLECPPIEKKEEEEKEKKEEEKEKKEEEKEKKEEEEKKENSPQENSPNKGLYIKSGMILLIAFLF